VLPALVAARGEPEQPSELERAVVDVVAEEGPCSTADLPGLVGYERKHVASAVDRLQRRLVLTTAGAQKRPHGWPAVIVDLLSRRYASSLTTLPGSEDARAEVSGLVLRSAGEVSAADVSAVVGCTRKQAAAALDRLADEGHAGRHEAEGFALYRRSQKRG
jgi:hypothetical protein